jgi:hypothetical protein
MPETLEEFDRILTKSGYRRYQNPELISGHLVAFYQKRVRDQKGVKFFIDCYLYKRKEHPINPEISVSFRREKAAYRLMEYAKDDFDLPATELLFLALWNTGNFNYSKIYGE